MGGKKETKQLKNPKFGLFEWLKEITLYKRPWSFFNDEQKLSYNSFMINRYLSMNPNYIELVNYIQFIPLSEKEKYYNIYREFIPKKDVYLKYIKSIKSNNDVLNSYISEYFMCSKLEASDYIDLMNNDEITMILQRRGIDNKEIKHLIK